MALKTITIADGTSAAQTHTIAAATASDATTFNSGESGYIQDIYVGGVQIDFNEFARLGNPFVLGLSMVVATGGTTIPTRVGSYIPEGAVISNTGPGVDIIVNIG